MHIKVKAAGLTGSDTLFYNLIFIYIWKTLRLQMKTIPEQDGSVIARIQLHFLKPGAHTRGGTPHKTRLLKSYQPPSGSLVSTAGCYWDGIPLLMSIVLKWRFEMQRKFGHLLNGIKLRYKSACRRLTLHFSCKLYTRCRQV